MKIVIQNSVRDVSTRELRRKSPGEVVAAPLIAGARLPPRRSRTVDSDILDRRDIETICRMLECGVVRVFSASPYLPLTEESIRKLRVDSVHEDPVPEPPVDTPNPTPSAVIEPEAAPEVIEEVPEEAPVAEPKDEPASQEHADLRAELMALKNADLRQRVAKLGGGNGTGMSKHQLVEAILSMSSEGGVQ
jgi:hypothetical protein